MSGENGSICLFASPLSPGLTLPALAQLDPNAPWPRWAHDNQCTGRGVKSLPSGYTGDRIRWIFDGFRDGETVEAGIVIDRHNRLYVPTEHGRIFCLDGATGQPVWQEPFDTEQAERAWTPAIIENIHQAPPPGPMGGIPGEPPYRIVFGCGDTLYCIQQKSVSGQLQPELVWERRFAGYDVTSCPAAVSHRRLYIGLHARGTYPGKVVCLDSDGGVLWELELDAEFQGTSYYDSVGHTSLAVGHNGTIYVSATPVSAYVSGTLYAITDNGGSGVVRWRYRPDFDGGGAGWSTGFSSPCVGDDGTVYFGTKDRFSPADKVGTLWAVTDEYDPVDLWHVSSAEGGTGPRPLGPLEGSPVVDLENNVYVGTNLTTVGGQADEVGVFVRASGPPPGFGAVLFQSPTDLNDPPEGDPSYANVDATACIAMATDGTFLAIFQSEEAGFLHKLDQSGNELWVSPPGPVQIRRTDLISVAMGPDGTLYVGTRYNADIGETHGFVFAVWGFDVEP